MREREQVEKVVSDTVEHFRRLDILVNNAGSATRASLTGITDDEWFRDIEPTTAAPSVLPRRHQPLDERAARRRDHQHQRDQRHLGGLPRAVRHPLASPAAAYFTGQVLRVCGGAVLG